MRGISDGCICGSLFQIFWVSRSVRCCASLWRFNLLKVQGVIFEGDFVGGLTFSSSVFVDVVQAILLVPWLLEGGLGYELHLRGHGPPAGLCLVGVVNLPDIPVVM